MVDKKKREQKQQAKRYAKSQLKRRAHKWMGMGKVKRKRKGW